MPGLRPAGCRDGWLRGGFRSQDPFSGSSPPRCSRAQTYTRQTHPILETSLLMLKAWAAASSHCELLASPVRTPFHACPLSPHSQPMNRAVLTLPDVQTNWKSHMISQTHPHINRRDRNQASTAFGRLTYIYLSAAVFSMSTEQSSYSS